MDYRDELNRLHHQLELAERMIPMIADRATAERLEQLAREIKGKLDDLETAAQHEEIRTRAFLLWQEAGQPQGLDLDFWLRAEAELLRSSGPRT